MLPIQEGKPKINGMYVAYVNGDFDNFADKIFLMWMDGSWSYPRSDQCYRDTVYGWIGPLPGLQLE